MKCFYHPDRDAVGFCSQCGKAACHDCLKELDGVLLCKGCIAQRVRTVEAEQKAVMEDQQARIERAKKRLRTSKIVFVVFFLFGIIVGVAAIVQALGNPAFQAQQLPVLIVGCLIGSAIAAYYAWSFYWGVPAVWGFVRRMFQGIGCFVVLNPITWLIVFLVFFMVLAFIGEFYCIFGGGWSQYRKNARVAKGEAA